MPVISLTKELSGDNPYSFPQRLSANLVIIENAFVDVDTNLAAVSGNLQVQIDNLDMGYATVTELQTVSGGLQVQIDNNFSTIQAVSGNLQGQIDNFSTSFIGLSDTPNTYAESDTFVVTVNGAGLTFTPQDDIVPEITNVRGQEDCVIGQQVYTISYGQTISGAQPVTSLVTPTSGATIFVDGIFDVTDTDFKVILSEAPALAGYSINWVTSFGSAVDLDNFVEPSDLNDIGKTLTFSTGLSGYNASSSDAGKVLYITGDIQLNQTPQSGEHLWIKNEGSTSADINGVAYLIEGLATQSIGAGSSYHLHFNGTQWSVI